MAVKKKFKTYLKKIIIKENGCHEFPNRTERDKIKNSRKPGYLNTGKTRKDAKRRGKKQKDAKRPGKAQKDAERRKKTAKRPRKLAKRQTKMYYIMVSLSRNSLQMYFWIILEKQRI